MRRELSGTENPNPLAQYVWHPHYVDALILHAHFCNTDDSNTGGTAERYYYTQDVIFNVMSIVSASGTVLERYSYTPYGQAEVLTASFTPDPDGKSDSDNDITFTGQRFDAESGLMLYRHRFYHTGLGTFCSRDPIGYRGSRWSLYEYVGGRPIVGIDPSGNFTVVIEGTLLGLGAVVIIAGVATTVTIGVLAYCAFNPGKCSLPKPKWPDEWGWGTQEIPKTNPPPKPKIDPPYFPPISSPKISDDDDEECNCADIGDLWDTDYGYVKSITVLPKEDCIYPPSLCVDDDVKVGDKVNK